MLNRRNLLIAAGAASMAGCTWFNTDTGEKKSCDWVRYDLNTGLDHMNSTASSPAWLANGSQQGKWAFNNMALDPNASHDANPIVAGDTLEGIGALPNSKWIKGTEDHQGTSELFIFTYCFCVDSDQTPTGFEFRELDVKTNFFLHRIWLDGGPILFEALGTGVTRFTLDRNITSHREYEQNIQNGLNCLNISVTTPTRSISPMGISAVGQIRGISCCS